MSTKQGQAHQASREHRIVTQEVETMDSLALANDRISCIAGLTYRSSARRSATCSIGWSSSVATTLR